MAREGRLRGDAAPSPISVEIAKVPSPAWRIRRGRRLRLRSAGAGSIEIEPGNYRVRVDHDVDNEALKRA